jgi:hypothetical protein
MTLTDYLPPGISIAFAGVVAWVFRDHAHRDDERFNKVAAALDRMSDKLDEAVTVQATSHSEILKILLEQNS